jgi:glycosyltransferase involved in cell wall biosynthesis
MSQATGRMRVLIVGPVPPPYGGIARYVQDLLGSNLATACDLDHFNTSFSARVRSHSVNPGHRRYQAGRSSGWLKYAYVFSNGPAQGFRTLSAGILSIPRLAWRIVRTRPDLVHVFANMHWGFWRAGAMVLVSRLLGRRVIFHPLGAIEQFYPSCGPVGRFMIRFLLNRADLILVQSPGLAEQVQPMTRRPVEGVFNGIDLEPFQSGPASPAAASDDGGAGPTFLAVGDLGHNKGTWDILAAATRVMEVVPGATFCFVGRGEIQDLETRSRDAGVEAAVIFLGSVSDDEKLAALRRADVFLLPSYAEGQPLSILEAMAAGLPVISTPVGSIAEVLEDGANGFLVKPGDVRALADAMIELGGDPGLRRKMGQRNLQDARERFDARRLWRDLGRFWQQVTGKGLS